VRSAVCERLGHLGVALDADANETAILDATVSAPDSSVRVVVIRAREDLIAARTARQLLERNT
jgi:acetate kinase